MELKLEHKYFLLSIVVCICITMVITLSPIWQLVIIPAIIAGFMNKKLRYSVLSGMIGVTLSWILYILFGLVTRNVLTILDQLGSLFLGENLGWVLLVLIILFSAIFGALGGGIGNGLLNLKNNILSRED